MRVWLVEYFTNNNVGTINGESCRDVNTAYVADSEENALTFCRENKDYAEEVPEWHWALSPWFVGGEWDVPSAHHYTRDCVPCDYYGEPDADPEETEEECDCDGDCDKETLNSIAKSFLDVALRLKKYSNKNKGCGK